MEFGSFLRDFFLFVWNVLKLFCGCCAGNFLDFFILVLGFFGGLYDATPEVAAEAYSSVVAGTSESFSGCSREIDPKTYM